MNVFISQPMKGLTDEQIENKRQEIETLVRERFNEDTVYILNTFFKDHNLGDRIKVLPVFMLGCSICELSRADLAVFAEGWKNNRGCILERLVCEKYHIPVVDFSFD